MVKNTMKLIEESKRKIDVRYDIHAYNICDIKENSNGIFDMICNSFQFGYMQGMKAAKAEMKKGGCNV